MNRTVTQQPDWNQIAEKFDLWLPHLAPVGEAMIARLQIQQGGKVLDIASGTGEPALTVARQYPDNVQVTAIDAAPAMVGYSRKKAMDKGLKNIHFLTMQAEQLAFTGHYFDDILCRFGVMLFRNPLKSLKEINRVLKKNGHFALAVWSTPETMLTLHWAYQVFKERVTADLYPPLESVTSLGKPGLIEQLLTEAGFQDFRVEKKTLRYQFTSFDEYWDLVEGSGVLKQQFDVLTTDQHDLIRDEVAQLAGHCFQDEQLIIPHEYLLISGAKSS